jgi:hypothetical protein
MAWIYSPELAGSHGHSSLGCDPTPTVSVSPTLRACCYLGWQTDPCQLHPSGTTCERCELITSICPSISLAGGSPAKTSALQELERAWKEAEADLYLTCSGSLASSDLSSFSWKTSQLSLFGGLTDFSWNSMRWGTMRDGRLFQPQKWEPRTSENESGFLPTPTAQEYGSNQSPSPGAQVRPSLSQMARKNLWPTPTVCGNDNRPYPGTASGFGLASAVKMWPTATARAWKDNGKSPSEFERNSLSLGTAVGGQLSPMWTEWLMGYPIGWTELRDWVTLSCLKRHAKHSAA